MNPIKKIAAALCIAGFSVTAVATPVTYDFSATDFLSLYGGAVPYANIAGSFTVDGTQVDAINLTIDSHSYALAEVGAITSFGDLIIGGTLFGITSLGIGTDDFGIVFNPITLSSFEFAYTTSNSRDYYSTRTGTVSVHQNAVPEPESLALIALGLLGAGVVRRRKVARVV